MGLCGRSFSCNGLLAFLGLLGSELHYLVGNCFSTSSHLLGLFGSSLAGSLDSSTALNFGSTCGYGSNSRLGRSESNNASITLLKVPIIFSTSDDTLSNVVVLAKRELSGGELSNSLSNGAVAHGLYGGLELVVTIEVD